MATSAKLSAPETSERVLTEIPVVTAKKRGPKLPENNPFRYWVDQLDLTFRAGVARYNPIRVTVTPGIQNVPTSGNPATSDGYQVHDLQRVAVPMSFRVLAWGEEIDGYMVEMVTGRDRNGKEMLHYRDVWTRYKVVGNSTVAVFDHAGFADFRLRVASLMGGPPDEDIADAKMAQERAKIDTLRRQAGSPAAAVDADALEKKITPKPKTPRKTRTAKPAARSEGDST